LLLGRVYRERGQTEEALNEFKFALTLTPHQAEIQKIINELAGASAQ